VEFFDEDEACNDDADMNWAVLDWIGLGFSLLEMKGGHGALYMGRN